MSLGDSRRHKTRSPCLIERIWLLYSEEGEVSAGSIEQSGMGSAVHNTWA